ncbi:uncharacterized protein BDV17DRAFT_294055 [Aspergillus undulatus]|uniref:uncharacterized protein n=1 Tax=Aspergillus undulatus TaxID=1810928 RepID=UPI003CCD6A3E
MVAESIQIREHELLLASPLSDNLVARILSQVNLMQILTHVYDRFSERRLPGLEYVKYGGKPGPSNSDSESATEMLSDTRVNRQTHSSGISPRRGVVLFSYFTKLQINSLAVRGVTAASGRLSAERKELAIMAVTAVVSILSLLLEEDNMRRSLVGTSLYVHTMIAFTSVFLMNVATKWNRLMGLNIEYTFVSRLLENMVVLLTRPVTSERHMLKHIARGLDEMLGRLKAAREAGDQRVTNPIMESSLDPENPQSVVPRWRSGFGPCTAETPTAGAVQLDSNIRAGGMQESGGLSYLYQYGAAEGKQDNTSLSFMDDAVLYQAFGTEATNDVYTLLSSQFQY